MDIATLTQSQQSQPRLAGAWRLEAGRAITLRPREDGELTLASGRLWVTFDGPHAGALNDSGDRVLRAGERLAVAAGRRVVLESPDAAPAHFGWDFTPAPQAAAVPPLAVVAQSLRDLREAAALAGGALGRLAAGLVRWGWTALLPPARGAHTA